jgi:carboxymethylenebutenolidase
VSKFISIALILAAAVSLAWPARAQDVCFTQPATYPSDELRLSGVLMKPAGIGPFPAVTYSHGPKQGRELQATVDEGTPCFPFVSERGWVYFVPDRRGYGRSEGPPLTSVIGNRSGLLLLLAVRTRARQEASDVLAGVEFLRRRPFADANRIGAVGYSLGGLVTYLAAATRPDAFRAIVLQAIGSAEYHSLLLREMIGAAGPITASILIQQASDDEEGSERFAQELATALRRAGKDVTVRVYPGKHGLFTPESRGPDGEWGKDLVEFLARQFTKPH